MRAPPPISPLPQWSQPTFCSHLHLAVPPWLWSKPSHTHTAAYVWASASLPQNPLDHPQRVLWVGWLCLCSRVQWIERERERLPKSLCVQECVSAGSNNRLKAKESLYKREGERVWESVYCCFVYMIKHADFQMFRQTFLTHKQTRPQMKAYKLAVSKHMWNVQTYGDTCALIVLQPKLERHSDISFELTL